MALSGEPMNPSYVLGHSDWELERLRTQASLIDPVTRRFFVGAGVGAGARVLDVGCGAGDTTFLAADLVGEAGEVVGVDRAPRAIARARDRAHDQSLRNVSFVEGDPAAMAFEGQFDAVVGRYVLMFQPDPALLLRKVARHVGPGGCLVFHELEWEGARSYPPVPAFDECCRWIAKTVRSAGADPQMGAKLASCFVDAGLAPPTLRVESVVAAGTFDGVVRLTVDAARTLLSAQELAGATSEPGINIETLADEIISQAAANQAVLYARAEIGAWAIV